MKTKQHGLLLAGLVVVMVAIYARALKPDGRRENKTPVQPPESAQVLESTAEAADTLPGVDISHRDDQRKRSEELSWVRDPFSKGVAEGQVGGLALSGILWDAQAPMAIVNGQTVHVGDEVEGYRITQITPKCVIVTDGAETFQLQNE